VQKCVTHTQTTVQYQPVKKLNLDGKHPLGSDSSRELQTDRNQTVLPQYTVLTPRKEYKKKNEVTSEFKFQTLKVTSLAALLRGMLTHKWTAEGKSSPAKWQESNDTLILRHFLTSGVERQTGALWGALHTSSTSMFAYCRHKRQKCLFNDAENY